MIPRFGDAYHQLPVRCWLAAPVRAPEYWTRFPVSQYEGLVGDLLGGGVPAPGHPAACAREACGHAQVWHQMKTRLHKCLVHGCECTGVVRPDVEGLPWAVPARVVQPAG